MNITLKNTIFTKQNSQNPTKTQFSYKLLFTEDINIKVNKDNNNINYNIVFPQKISFNTLYSTNVVTYNNIQPTIDAIISNNKLVKLYYHDQGIKIYDQENNLVSLTENNLIDINHADNSLNIDIKSTGNKIIDNSNQDGNFSNKDFNIIFVAQYSDLSIEKKDLYKKLIISNFNINFADLTIDLNADLVQDARNLVPYGTINLSAKNYRLIIDSFYNSLQDQPEDPNTPAIFIDMKNNPEKFKLKTIKLLEKINNDNSDLLKLTITRETEALPYINNLSSEEISNIFYQIYNHPSQENNSN